MLARLPVLAILCCVLAAARTMAEPPAIDDYAYDPAAECRKRPSAGALALVEWLERTAGGVSWGILRCELWGKGRASSG